MECIIGTGGHGQVYCGRDKQLHRKVAIKVAHGTTSCDLLIDEARRVARLRHRNIVCVHDVGQHDDRVFLVFEFIEG